MSFGERFHKLFGVRLPIVQAPMAGASDAELAIAVSEAGGLGSLPCAMLMPDQVRSSVEKIRQRTANPFNLNFFCHRFPAVDAEREREWQQGLAAYYREFGIDPSTPAGERAVCPSMKPCATPSSR